MKSLARTPGLFLTTLLIFASSVYGQNEIINLTFTANYQGEHLPLDSILVQNLTQGGDTMLYAPDTVLQIDYSSGFNEEFSIENRVLFVSQNIPNPFSEMTTISIHVTEKGDAEILIRNTLGQRMVHKTISFEPGTHQFDFFPGNDKFYLLSVSFNGVTRSIKMIRSGGNVTGQPALTYSGLKTSQSGLKAQNIAGGFNFSPGDLLRYTGYAAIPAFTLGSDELVDEPFGNQNYLFHIVEGIRCPGEPSITDIDGNTYNTLLIGDHCWLRENLKTTFYRDGSPIPNVTDSASWVNLTTGAFAWYDNNTYWKDKFGALYNWHAVNDPAGLCPEGWHVSTNREWELMAEFIGEDTQTGDKLKSCRQINSPLGGDCNTTQHPRWNQNNTHYGTDDYGFSGLPSGVRRHYNAEFAYRNEIAHWWTSNEAMTGNAFYWFLFYNNGSLIKGSYFTESGHSVRCVRDSDKPLSANFSATPINGNAPLTVSFKDLTINLPSGYHWDFGDGNTSNLQNPVHKYTDAGHYSVQLIVTSSNDSDTLTKNNYVFVIPEGSGQPCPGIPTLTDIDGNTYNTVLIGEQCWMKENLKTTTFRNGEPIIYNEAKSAKGIMTNSAYSWYDNDSTWKDLYGALYNWYAVDDTNGLCPEGWHVPTNSDWNVLTDVTWGTTSPYGNMLKSCRQINSPMGGDCNTDEHPRWEEGIAYLTHGTDEYGFSGLPGGFCSNMGVSYNIGYFGNWWSATEVGSNSAWYRYLSYSNKILYSDSHFKNYGLSVRCLKDPE